MGNSTTTRARPLDPVLMARENLIAALQNMTEALRVGRARVFQTPRYRWPEGGGGGPVCINDPSEGDLIGLEGLSKDEQAALKIDEFIPVRRPPDSRTSMRLAQAIYQKVDRAPNQPPERPDRLPGLIWLPRADRRALELVDRVNIAKKTLREALDQLEPNRKRRREMLLGSDMQHMLLLEALRQVLVIDEPNLARISFTWSGGSSVVENMTRDQVLDLLAGFDQGDGIGGPGRWDDQIHSLDDRYFARVRLQEPFVVANYRVHAPARKGQGPRLVAPIPIIVTCEREPEVDDLKTYLRPRRLLDATDPSDPQAQAPEFHSQLQGKPRKPRSDMQVDPEPLIPGLGIHRYRGLLRNALPPLDMRRGRQGGRARATSEPLAKD